MRGEGVRQRDGRDMCESREKWLSEEREREEREERRGNFVISLIV